ncbi:MAG: VOC family protein, partial [Anaerolineaceae bacterium]|nr:VOC family protein [Anaerolineaceae bacterium]
MTEMIAAATTIGEVQLFVADLDRAVNFYEKELGFQLLERGDGQASLGAGERRLVILNERPGAKPAQGTTGLYH